MSLVDAPISHENNPDFAVPDALLSAIYGYHQLFQKRLRVPKEVFSYRLAIHPSGYEKPVVIHTVPKSSSELGKLGSVFVFHDTGESGEVLRASTTADHSGNAPITDGYNRLPAPDMQDYATIDSLLIDATNFLDDDNNNR